MTKDETQEVDELEDVGFDKRIIKLLKFLGEEDFSRIQNIKMQRQFDIHQDQYIREQVVLGYTRVIGHSNDIVITDEYIKLLPKFYSMDGYYEKVEEFAEGEVEDRITAQKKKRFNLEEDKEEQ
jgi:hypothetical protein